MEERVEYIFGLFHSAFPDVKYKAQRSYLGIGRSGQRLLCYFAEGKDGRPYIKFHSSAEKVYILADSSVIDKMAEETIEFFRKNEEEVTFRDSKTTAEKEKTKEERRQNHLNGVKDLLRTVDDSYNDVEILPFCSQRLRDRLVEANVSTIRDLKAWKGLDDLNIYALRNVFYPELYFILKNLSDKDILEKSQSKSNLYYLYYPCNKYSVEKCRTSPDISDYLSSIGYDETEFEPNMNGWFLCMEKKHLSDISPIVLTDDKEKIKERYNDRIGDFPAFQEEIIPVFQRVLKDAVKYDRQAEMIELYYFPPDPTVTLATVGKKYGVTREAVRLLRNKAATNANQKMRDVNEKGLRNSLERYRLLKKAEEIGIEAFFVFLKRQKGGKIAGLFETLFLSQCVVPDDFYDVVDEIIKEYKEKETFSAKKDRKKPSQKNSREKRILLVVDPNGWDAELLLKLQKARKELAGLYAIPPYCIYKNKQLEILATYRPTTKEEYLGLGFTDKSWDRYGEIILGIINDHLATG